MGSYELHEAVNNDKREHRIKELAILLLNAMNDWPTPNQTRIELFVEEIKKYYGDPITLEKINSKKVNLNENHNAWRQEAGISIVKIIEISTQFEFENDFEKIVKRILDFYQTKQND